MSGFVYILLSLKDGKTYVGSTDDLIKRLREHQRGLVKSTKNRLPIRLLLEMKFKTLEEARYMEKYYKSSAGRKKLKLLLKDKL
ncbi:MAG TPA: endonuclease [Candidatus Moranbacteria bacterium]|nr:endonuclease [Candidatus Moranbacteria bacterium]HBT45976.1 endonuclease [Candidatus Moranbacteria bacterium]